MKVILYAWNFYIIWLSYCNLLLSIATNRSHEDIFSEALHSYDVSDYDTAFKLLIKCVSWDSRCQHLMGEYYFLGLTPLEERDVAAAVCLWKSAADLGNADAQYGLALIFFNFLDLPSMIGINYQEKTITAKQKNHDGVKVDDLKYESFYVDSKGGLHIHDNELRYIYHKFGVALTFQKSKSLLSLFCNSGGYFKRLLTHIFTRICENYDVPSLFFHRQTALGYIYMYAAALAGHTGALVAMGNQHDIGLHTAKSCTTAAMYFLEAAKDVVHVYSSGIPQAVELIRFSFPPSWPSSGSNSQETTRNKHQSDLLLHVATHGNNRKMQTAVGKRYLLGIDGFPQNYSLAYKYLQMSSNNGHSEAMCFLAYMYAFGLGVKSKDLDKAAYWFNRGATIYKEPLCMNGMGYIYFFGTATYRLDHNKAFQFFNDSAHENVADAQFNLATMYMTGSGTSQSYISAIQWLTKAIEQGHTPAAYGLAIMHLNGLGTIKDCALATALLKRVAERGEWFTKNLQKAYDYEQAGYYDESAYIFWKLGEAGHELSQSNLAALLESGQSNLFLAKDYNAQKIYAQRFLELASLMGSVEADLKLGDYAYYGWGSDAYYEKKENNKLIVDDYGNDMSDWIVEYVLRHGKAQPNYKKAVAYYRRAAEAAINHRHNKFSSRAMYNLGYMHMKGYGVPQDLHMARRYYEKVLESTENVTNYPIILSIWILSIYEINFYSNIKKLGKLIFDDIRIIFIFCCIFCIVFLTGIRYLVKKFFPIANWNGESNDDDSTNDKKQD